MFPYHLVEPSPDLFSSGLGCCRSATSSTAAARSRPAKLPLPPGSAATRLGPPNSEWVEQSWVRPPPSPACANSILVKKPTRSELLLHFVATLRKNESHSLDTYYWHSCDLPYRPFLAVCCCLNHRQVKVFVFGCLRA